MSASGIRNVSVELATLETEKTIGRRQTFAGQSETRGMFFVDNAERVRRVCCVVKRRWQRIKYYTDLFVPSLPRLRRRNLFALRDGRCCAWTLRTMAGRWKPLLVTLDYYSPRLRIFTQPPEPPAAPSAFCARTLCRADNVAIDGTENTRPTVVVVAKSRRDGRGINGHKLFRRR